MKKMQFVNTHDKQRKCEALVVQSHKYLSTG